MHDIAVVIPAFNEAGRLRASLEAIVDYLDRRELRFELVVVDDGSTDGTAEVADSLQDPRVRCLSHSVNRGKGAAVRSGVAATQASRVLVSDADLSTPIEELEQLEAHLSDSPIVFASRAVQGARLGDRQPLYRELLGRGFNRWLRLWIVRGIADTQCGFKLLEGELARELFGQMKIDGFAFDVELAYLARRARVPIAEVGVEWHHRDDSKVRVGRDSVGVFFDVCRLPFLHRSAPSLRVWSAS